MAEMLLPEIWKVPQEFRNRLGKTVGRQRAMYSDGHLLLVLHLPPQPDENERRGRFLWRQPDGTWSSSDGGAGPAVVETHLEEYAEVIERYDRMEEEASSADAYFEVLEGLAPVCRAARNLHTVLQEARKLCPEDRDIINFRDQAYETERTAELLYNGAKNSLDFAVAKRAEEQARSSRQMAGAAHRLNVLAAFFFPLATLSAIFGVNLRHGFEEIEPPLAFLILVAVGLVFGGLLAMFLRRPSKPRQRR